MIHEEIGVPATFEGLAEEATEVAQVALKIARILRGESPTPVTLEEAISNLEKEWSQLNIYAVDLGLEVNGKVCEKAVKRFEKRMELKKLEEALENLKQQPQQPTLHINLTNPPWDNFWSNWKPPY